MLPLATASRICVGRLAGASVRQRVAETEDSGAQQTGLAAESVPGECRHTPRQLRGDVFGRQRKTRQRPAVEVAARSMTMPSRLALELTAGGQVRPVPRQERSEPPLGNSQEIRGWRRAGHGHVAANRTCYNVCMINVSETAASKISELLTEENKAGSGLRVFVQGGGCSGFQYGLMIEENGQGSGDQVFESHGVKLFVDPISIRYLNGAEVDFVDTVTGGGFTIKNPHATSTCGCGQSFSVE